MEIFIKIIIITFIIASILWVYNKIQSIKEHKRIIDTVNKNIEKHKN